MLYFGFIVMKIEYRKSYYGIYKVHHIVGCELVSQKGRWLYTVENKKGANAIEPCMAIVSFWFATDDFEWKGLQGRSYGGGGAGGTCPPQILSAPRHAP